MIFACELRLGNVKLELQDHGSLLLCLRNRPTCKIINKREVELKKLTQQMITQREREKKEKLAQTEFVSLLRCLAKRANLAKTILWKYMYIYNICINL